MELFDQHRALARRLADRYDASALIADLRQVADIALYRAALRHRPEVGPFERFAAVTISGELKKFLRSNGWAVHVPRRVQEDALSVQKAIDRLWVELGRAPRVSEVARDCGITTERVGEALRARAAQYGDEPDPEHPPVDDGTASLIDHMEVRAAVARLGSSDRRLIELVFDRDLTQRDVATVLGISQSRVQRRLQQIFDQLRPGLAPVAP